MGHEVLLNSILIAPIVAKKKNSESFRRMIREGKSGTQERSGEELSEGHWGIGEDKIRHCAGKKFLHPVPRDKRQSCEGGREGKPRAGVKSDHL